MAKSGRTGRFRPFVVEPEVESSDDDDSERAYQLSQLEEIPMTSISTRRLAIVNMFWEKLTAEDLFVCCHSFKPADGIVHSVKIYQSEYGFKLMEKEKVCGPDELVEETLFFEGANERDIHREKLRQYQINRLKYYYAVVECDSAETANVLYDQMDFAEYESSSVTFDLRIIPDDVTFDKEPTDIATDIPEKYKAKNFYLSAVQNLTFECTWDKNGQKRKEMLHKAFSAPEEFVPHLKDYLAEPSSEEEIEPASDGPKMSEARKAKFPVYRELIHHIDEKEKMKKRFDWDNFDPDLGESVQSNEEPDKKLETTEDEIAKYRAVVLSHEKKEKKKEKKKVAEITLVPGLKQKTEELVKKRMAKDTLAPCEEMLQKKKDKKLKKKTAEINGHAGLKQKTEELVKKRMAKDTLAPCEEMLQKKKDKKLKKKRQKSMDMQIDESEDHTDSVGSSKDTKQVGVKDSNSATITSDPDRKKDCFVNYQRKLTSRECYGNGQNKRLKYY